jgi:colanic acid biosynthesis glycosyl transferase WcaI
MRILLLNQYFPPDTAATAKIAHLIAEALAQRHQVTVLAGRPSYNPIERHPRYLLHREVRGNLVVERVGSTTFPRHRIHHRLSNYVSYVGLAVSRALTIRTDLILTMTDPPIAGIAGALVARLKRLPFVYNIQDLYPDMALGARIVQPVHWVKTWEYLHRRTLEQASLVIVLGEDMYERVITKGIRCGFPFVVLHAGNLGFYGAWETLIGAAKLLDEEGVGFIFVGDGVAKSGIETLVNGFPRVRFLPFRPPEEIPYVLAAADIHVVTVRRGLEGVVVPSKLYSVLAAGRPVLAVVPEKSDVARIVTRSGCGVVVDPDSPASVAEAIRNLVRDRGRLEQMAQRAQAIASEYGIEKQLERFVQVVERVIPQFK